LPFFVYRFWFLVLKKNLHRRPPGGLIASVKGLAYLTENQSPAF
jgi:hypothetical protein